MARMPPPPSAAFGQAIQFALLNLLYDPVEIRHLKQIEDLILKNTLMVKGAMRAFRYKGELYRSEQAPRGPIMSLRLHPDLAPEMDNILEEKAYIHSQEKPLVEGYIRRVLNCTQNLGDVLKVFPAATHSAILELNLMSLQASMFPTDAHVALFIQYNEKYIQAMKERMATNLLFSL